MQSSSFKMMRTKDQCESTIGMVMKCGEGNTTFPSVERKLETTSEKGSYCFSVNFSIQSARISRKEHQCWNAQKMRLIRKTVTNQKRAHITTNLKSICTRHSVTMYNSEQTSICWLLVLSVARRVGSARTRTRTRAWAPSAGDRSSVVLHGASSWAVSLARNGRHIAKSHAAQRSHWRSCFSLGRCVLDPIVRHRYQSGTR